MSYEYAALATITQNGEEEEVIISLGNDEETGKVLAQQYLDDSFVQHNPDTFITGYRVVRRRVGEWEDYTGESDD